MSDKALKACADYARLNSEIRRLTRVISNALDHCNGVRGELKAKWFVERPFDSPALDDKTHLKAVYEGEVVYSYPEPYHRHYETAELVTMLSVCEHCLAAHEAIQARKAARKSLGATKRFITMIGRSAK